MHPRGCRRHLGGKPVLLRESKSEFAKRGGRRESAGAGEETGRTGNVGGRGGKEGEGVILGKLLEQRIPQGNL